MSLNSLQFIVCFAALYIVLFITGFFRNKYKIAGKIQLITLLLFSYFFIFTYSYLFCACIFIYTLLIYFLGLYVKKSKLSLTTGIVASICMLGYFKYTNFFLSCITDIAGTDRITFNIILPIGISFYIFSGIAYLIDVYRGDYEAERSFINLALYIAFFPKITAGPIVRGKNFFPQAKNYRGLTVLSLHDGIQIFVFGLFKKLVLADHLGVFVNDVFHSPLSYSSGTVLLGAISYSLQIYLDFSGYSDMAVGIARLVGFDFNKNFNLPYIAKGMSDFWKRWHISLSSWFQDYLYIPLGGSKKGNLRTYINLIIVMAISGLWHGAGLTFILWGILHGLGSCFSRVISKSKLAKNKIFSVIRILVTYITVSLLWILFRADSFINARDFYTSLFIIHDGIWQPYTWSFIALLFVIISTIIAIIKTKNNKESYVNGFYPIMDLTKISSLVIFFTICGLIILLGYFGNTAFIYGKF